MSVDGCVFSCLAGVNLRRMCVQPFGWCQPMHVDGCVFRTGCTCSSNTNSRHDTIMAGVLYANLMSCPSWFLPSVDVFSSGVWPLLSNLEDPELRRLAKALPATVLKCKADSTTKKYLGAFQRWKTWAEARRGVPSFPVQEIHLVLYLQHLSESIQSKSAVEEAVHAVSWLHQMAGLPSIAGSPIVQATLGGLRRELAKPKKRKEPVTAEMLLAMVEAAGPSPSLTEVRLLDICLVAFC